MSVESSALFSIDIVLRNYASENVIVELIADNFTMDPLMTICDYELTGKGNSGLSICFKVIIDNDNFIDPVKPHLQQCCSF